MAVDEHTITLDESPVRYRSAAAPKQPAPAVEPEPAARLEPGARAPTLYLHGVPTSSDDWVPFLERTGGIAPDLIGFGRSGKGGHLEYTPQALARFVTRLLDELGLEHIDLVAHDWGGAIALLVAAHDPDRIERLILIDAVPLTDGFTWHRYARLWRRPVIGELVMGATSRPILARALRHGTVSPDAWSEARLADVWDQFDQGTQRAILRLYRSAPETQLAALGKSLPRLDAPSLIVWGERDPWLAPELAEREAALLEKAEVCRVPGAGHWPWLDQPDVIETVAEFLAR